MLGLVVWLGYLAASGQSPYGISANDVVTHPEDAPAKMALEATANGWTFPYLFDETQEVAKAYGAACTPDFFLFDEGRRLVYRGQLDDSRRLALDDLPAQGLRHVQARPLIAVAAAARL